MSSERPLASVIATEQTKHLVTDLCLVAMKYVTYRDLWDALPVLHRGYKSSQELKQLLEKSRNTYYQRLDEFRELNDASKMHVDNE